MKMTSAAKKQEIVANEEKLPASILEQIDADSGKGVSTAQEDNLVPLIYVLQGLSPQVNKRNDNYMADAEPGDIWLRNSPEPIIKGSAGLIFQPCYFSKDWVEWIPRDAGGGFVGRYAKLPAEAKKVEDPDEPNVVRYEYHGNEIKETRYHVGYAFTEFGAMPYVIPFTGSGHSVSRAWMFMLNSHFTKKGTKIPPWGQKYRLITKYRKNKKGEWFVFEPHFTELVSDISEYERGKKLYEAFASGVQKAEDEVETEVKGF